MKKKISIVEVGLRDGLQNEKIILSTRIRQRFAMDLVAAGLRRIESGAFVSPKWVPQMAGSAELTLRLLRSQEKGIISPKVCFSGLVANEHGMQTAVKTGVNEIALFTGCSETFVRKNINCSIDESFNRFANLMKIAKSHKMKVRGYLSTCFGCPYEGKVNAAKVVELANRFMELGVFEISIGDTIGIANPDQVAQLIKRLLRFIPAKNLAGHFHDTLGLALANVLISYQMGIRVFDSSLGGLGGCPYAPGAAGNVATEDLVNMFESMGVHTGIDLAKLVQLNTWVSRSIKRPLASHYSQAMRMGPILRKE